MSRPIRHLSLRLRLLALAALVMLVGCGYDDPTRDLPPQELAADKIACPDQDGDQFSTDNTCTVFDCNDHLDFIGDRGYCRLYDHLVFDPWALSDVTPADFCIIKRDSLYHIFYTTGWNFAPSSSRYFAHAATTDGETWFLQPAGMAIDPTSDWDDAHIWAPCIVLNPKDGLYYMFYTGVTRQDPTYHREERIGVATSSALAPWRRVDVRQCGGVDSPGCVWDADLPWTGWNSGTYYARQCRDPFVFRDAVANCWYLVYSTTSGDGQQMILGLARSADLLEWTDCGPISCSQGWTAESSHVFVVDGVYYLLWTNNGDGGIAYSRSTSMEGDLWEPTAMIPGTVEGHQFASEAFQAEDWLVLGYIREYLREFRFRKLAVTDTGGLITEDIALFTCRYLGAENVYPGAPEVANGVDDNCNQRVDEVDEPCVDLDGDGYGSPASLLCHYRERDCDDGDPLIHPRASGDCANGLDDNCDGMVDDPTECLRLTPIISRH